MLNLPVTAGRELVLWRACIAAGVLLVADIPVFAPTFGYAVWLLQRISNLFRVSLYSQLQEPSLRFHSEEKIGDAIFRMFQDSAIDLLAAFILLAPYVMMLTALSSVAASPSSLCSRTSKMRGFLLRRYGHECCRM